MTDLLQEIKAITEQLHTVITRLEALQSPPTPWAYPVGSTRYPTPFWYAATFHDLTGRRNGGYRHSGIDLNVQTAPRGDIDRGEPIFAVTAGEVHDKGYSPGWLGVVVVRCEYNGQPLWFRYAHLDIKTISVAPGDLITTGQCLGHIGNYTRGRGGDHLHFDCALDPFGWGYWLTRWVRWVDPVPILKTHLTPSIIDAMLSQAQPCPPTP